MMSTAVEGKSANPDAGNSWQQTFWYIGGAAAFLAVTGIAEFATRPAAIEDYGKVGQVFYEDFVDPTLASSLEVYLFDADTLRPVDFRVERLENGRWVIPSHHNYPADAEEQLAQTAASTIGIKRGALMTRWSADHSRYGVVNPKQDSLTVDQVEGVGQRIIFRKGDDSVLADYIIGKQVDGEDDQYYVRHPDEDEVYITALNIDLSTKFTDWIDTKMYEFSNGEIVRLSTNNYSFNELSNVLTKRDVTTLEREKAWSEDWELESLADTEELNKDAIRETVDAIADLEVIGVRPKEKGLTPDLRLDRNAISSQRDIAELQADLQSRGFLLQPSESGGEELMLISREGELYAGTEDGLIYRMYFGRVFTGSQEELEIGFAASGSKTEDPTADGDAEQSEDQDPAEPQTDKPGRYMFVRVELDKSLLGVERTKPTEPTKSEELLAAEKSAADDESGEAADAADATTADEAAEAEAEAADAEADEEAPEETELERMQREFAEAEQQYRDDLRAFEEYEDKVKKAEEKAETLNRRFAEWYYVIQGESFDKLKLGRADLVKAKEPAEGEAAGGDSLGVLTTDANAQAPVTEIESAESDAPVSDASDQPDPLQSEPPSSDDTADEVGDSEAVDGDIDDAADSDAAVVEPAGTGVVE